MKYQNTCRICLKKNINGLKTSIFSQIGDDDVTIAEKIALCADIKITENPNLPQKVCQPCVKSLDAAYKFRKLCRNSDSTLQIIENKKLRNNIIVSMDSGQTYTLPEAIKIKVVKPKKERITDSPEKSYETEIEYLEDENEEYDEMMAEEYDDDDDDDDVDIDDEVDDMCIKSEYEEIIDAEEENIVKVKVEEYDEDDVDGEDDEIYEDDMCYSISQCEDIYYEEENADDEDKDESFEIAPAKTRKKITKKRNRTDEVISSKDSVNGKSSTNKKKTSKKSETPASFICDLCGNVYKQNSQLNLHMKRHRNEKNVPCEICGKLFLTVSMMKKHLLRHTGNKPFSCQYCPRKFYETGDCRAHERTHTGDRPYSCQLCGKSFTYSNTLKKHMLIHAGVKLHRCDLCKKQFRLKHHLLQHFQTILHTENAEKANNLITTQEETYFLES